MTIEPLVVLNTLELERRMNELGLKQWWIAEQISVSKRTVTRWLGGSAQRTQKALVERLARVLECPVERLLVCGPHEINLTGSEFEEAARVVASEDLLTILGRSQKWRLCESILQAFLVPCLPLSLQGRLSSKLALVKLMRGDLRSADRYGEFATRFGGEANDDLALVEGLGCRCIAWGYAGLRESATRFYEEARLRFSVVPLRTEAIVRVLYARVLVARECFAEASEVLFPLDARLRDSGDFCSLSRVLTLRGVCHAALEHLPQAADDLNLAAEFAGRCGWFVQEAMARAHAAVVEVRCDRREIALGRLASARELLAQEGVEADSEFLLAEADVLRLSGAREQAEAILARCVELPDTLPLFRLKALREMAAILSGQGELERAHAVERRASYVKRDLQKTFPG